MFKFEGMVKKKGNLCLAVNLLGLAERVYVFMVVSILWIFLQIDDFRNWIYLWKSISMHKELCIFKFFSLEQVHLWIC